MATIAEALAVAVQYHRAGHLREAEQIYRQIVQADPNHAEAWCQLGINCLTTGKLDEAVTYCRRALALRPDYQQAQDALAQALRRQNQPESAAGYPSPDAAEAGAYNQRAVALARQGNLAEAAAHLQEALRRWPDSSETHNNLGSVFFSQGQHQQAEVCYRQALRLSPDLASAYSNLGNALKMQGNLDDAVANYQQAVRLQPHFIVAHNNLGATFLEQGKLVEAAACYQQAVQLEPDSADAHFRLSDVLRMQGRLDEAAAACQQTLRLKPDHFEGIVLLAAMHRERGQLNEAVACYRHAIRLKPDFVQAYNGLGTTLAKQSKHDEASASLREAVRLQPDYTEGYFNLGIILRDQGKLDEAVACLQQAVHLKPSDADVHNALGTAFQQQGKIDEALACYEEAIHLVPDHANAHWNRSVIWLLQGNFAQGWAEYEWRWTGQGISLRSFPQPPWDGSPLAGRRILIYAEQGLGDSLQFVRYAPLVKERGGHVIVAIQPYVLRLLASCPGIDVLLSEDTPLPDFDVHVPLHSLPRLLGTSLATIPANVPYLFADAVLRECWRAELASVPGFKIGIVWQGSPRHTADHKRSVPLTRFAPLARLEGVRLFSLQKGPGREQLSAFAASWPIIDLGSRFQDFADTAAAMSNLDLVISVDSAPVHCAGALGIPVWLALAFAADWRWLWQREDCPWYPSMRLFRQKRPGDWDEVFERIVAEARRTVGS